MDTLPDYLEHDLDIVVVGLNPSPASVARGYYYGHERNRFWPALRRAGLVSPDFEPGPQALAALCEEEGIGFTDIVKRPTPGAADLRATDYREWAPELKRRLRVFRPRIAWFNGKGVYENYLRHACGIRPEGIGFGRQPEPVDDEVVAFVTPNPSPANAAYSLDVLAEWYGQVRQLRDRLRNA